MTHIRKVKYRRKNSSVLFLSLHVLTIVIYVQEATIPRVRNIVKVQFIL